MTARRRLRTGSRLVGENRHALRLALVLLVCLLASACGGGGGSEVARALPANVANDFRSLIARTNVGQRQITDATGQRLGATVDRLAELRAQALNRGTLTQDARALVTRASIAQTAATDIRQTLSDADQAAAEITGAAQQIAEASNPGGDSFVTVRVREAAQKILPDIACDVAWVSMAPSEQENADVHGEQRSLDVVQEASVEAIGNYLAEVALRGISQAALSAFQWSSYANGLVNKATDLTPSNLDATVTLPNGAVYTRAAYYYARLCLRLPGA